MGPFKAVGLIKSSALQGVSDGGGLVIFNSYLTRLLPIPFGKDYCEIPLGML